MLGAGLEGAWRGLGEVFSAERWPCLRQFCNAEAKFLFRNHIFKFKEKTLTCLNQTGESFSLNLKIAISSMLPIVLPNFNLLFAPPECAETPAKSLQALSKQSPSTLKILQARKSWPKKHSNSCAAVPKSVPELPFYNIKRENEPNF